MDILRKIVPGDCLSFNEFAGMVELPVEVEKDVCVLADAPFDNDDDRMVMLVNDITDFYISHWQKLSMGDKKKKAQAFKRIHEFVCKVRGEYNIYTPNPHVGIPDACPTCNGTGLFVFRKREYVKTICPECEGTKKKTVVCKDCNGHGCDICDGKGKIQLKGICKTCAIESPFGLMAGSGYVIRQKYSTSSASVCKKCYGSGRIRTVTK